MRRVTAKFGMICVCPKCKTEYIISSDDSALSYKDGGVSFYPPQIAGDTVICCVKCFSDGCDENKECILEARRFFE